MTHNPDPVKGPAQLLALIPDLEEIEAGFNAALELYAEAFEQIAAAEAAIKRAYEAVEVVTPGSAFHSERDGHEVAEFHKAVQLPSRETYLQVARKLVTLKCWHYVIDRCGLRQLMDAQARKEFDAQLRYVPERSEHDRVLITGEEADRGAPPFTADTVRATLAKFGGDAAMIWRRGIANAFAGLDRRFRSHDGFKVGSRVILTYLVDGYGGIQSYGSTADTLADIERTFLILDGRDPRHAQSSLLHLISRQRHGYHPQQSTHESTYMRVRIYKNGNAHLWFTRDDLVEKVNQELAAFYGEVIGDGNTVEPDPLESRAVGHARLFGFYPTPKDLAEKIAALVPYSETPLRILEPSAGTGNLAFAVAAPRPTRDGPSVQHRVDAVEIQPELATRLRESGKLARVTLTDFLQFQPNPLALYDGVVANFPFDMERDLLHCTHALKFLRPDGWLLAIVSAGTEFRETRRAAAFRKLWDERKGWFVDLPAGSFASVGTHVNTALIGFGIPKPWGFGR